MMSRMGIMFFVFAFSTFVVGCANTSSKVRKNSQPPVNSSQMVALARLAERQDDPEKARSLFEQLIAQQLELPTAHHRLGVLAAKRGNLELADLHFAQARAAGLDSIELQSDEAYNKLLAGDLVAADQLFQAILGREPKHKRTLNNLAVLRAKQGRFDEALLCSRGAVGPAKAYANVGYLFTQFGELSMAKDNYHRALAKDPDLKIAAHALIQLQEVPEIPRLEVVQSEALAGQRAEPDSTPQEIPATNSEIATENQETKVVLASHQNASFDAPSNELVESSDPVAFYEAMQSQQDEKR